MSKSVKEYHPSIITFVVYKDNGGWRGFCNPYDVTCQAETKKETINRLEKLVKLYEDGLKKYGYPKYLSKRPLSDQEDKIVFKVVSAEVRKKIILEIASEIEQDSSQLKMERYKEPFRIENPLYPSGYSSGYYNLCPTS